MALAPDLWAVIDPGVKVMPSNGKSYAPGKNGICLQLQVGQS